MCVCVCVCVCVFEGERVWVCVCTKESVCEREKGLEKEYVFHRTNERDSGRGRQYATDTWTKRQKKRFFLLRRDRERQRGESNNKCYLYLELKPENLKMLLFS